MGFGNVGLRGLVGGAVALVAWAGAGSAQTGAGGAVTVPVRMEAGRIVVPVKSGAGETLDFVLSTGSMVTVYSTSGAARVGARPQLTLGGLPVPTEGAQTVGDDALKGEGRVFDGMISSNMLNQFDILLDVPGGKLTLKPVASAVRWDGVALSPPTPLRIFHGVVLSLDVSLNGHRYPAALELGTPMVVANAKAATEAGVQDGGTGAVAVGGATVEGLPIRVMDLEVLRRFSPNGDPFVLVGAPLAYRCALAISWAHREIRTCQP